MARDKSGSKRDNIEPAGPQNEKAKEAQAKRHEQRKKDFDQADWDQAQDDD